MGEETGNTRRKTVCSSKKRNAKDDDVKGAAVASNFTVFSLPDTLKLTDIEDSEQEDYFDPATENDELDADMKSENLKLIKILADKEQEILQLKKKCSEASFNSINLPSDVAAIKIVELSKKIRDMTAELESEKTKNKQLHRTVRELENKNSVNGSGANIKQEPETDLKSELNTELKDKLNSSNIKLAEYRNTCQSLKKDLKMAHKVLLHEVGDSALTQAALTGSGWRGRAQQILSLQNKVAELKDQLEKQKTSDNVGIDDGKMTAVSSSLSIAIEMRHKEQIKKLEKDRKDENEKLLSDLKSAESDQHQLKDKLLASKSRIQILNNENQKLKARMSALVTKGQHDDELIKAYTDQVLALQHSTKHLQSLQGTDHDINEVRKQHQDEVIKLRKIINDREEQIIKLQDEIQNLKRSHSRRSDATHSSQGSNSAPVSRSFSNLGEGNKYLARGIRSSEFLNESRNGILPELGIAEEGASELEDLQVMCFEYRTVAQAAQVEKEKLLELVTVLNKRVDEAIARAIAAEERIHEIQLRNVQLEKQTEKATLEASGKSSRRSLFNSSRASNEMNSTIAELKANVQVLKDEKETLQKALQNILKAKEDDLKIYQEIINHAQDIFTKGLHNYSER